MSLTILFGTIYGLYYTILISFYLYLRLAITNYHARWFKLNTDGAFVMGIG